MSHHVSLGGVDTLLEETSPLSVVMQPPREQLNPAYFEPIILRGAPIADPSAVAGPSASTQAHSQNTCAHISLTVVAPTLTSIHSFNDTARLPGLAKSVVSSVVEGTLTKVAEVCYGETHPPRALSTWKREATTRGLFIGTAGQRERSDADVGLSQRAFLKYLKRVDPDNVRVHLGKGRVDDLDWLLSPDNIVPGDMLVLLVTGHASLNPLRGTVTFEFETREGVPVDTLVLQRMINKLPAYCTLEVIIGTCHSEAGVIGLHRIWVADSPKVVAASGLPITTPRIVNRQWYPRGSHCDANNFVCGTRDYCSVGMTLPSTRAPPSWVSLGGTNPLATGATVVVWAAALTNEFAYTEAKLPGQKGRYCTMIGAMFRILASGCTNVTRRTLCAEIGHAARIQYIAREERDRARPAERLWRQGPRIQTPLLLSSMNVPDRVLDGYAFQPIHED